jgi:type IV pilus assembly protein PilC
MPKFKYVAVDPKGNETSGNVDAESQARVIEMIKEQGWFPTSVTEVGGGAGGGAKKASGSKTTARKSSSSSKGKRGGKGLQADLKLPGFLSAGRAIKPKDLAAFTRQLSTLLDAGLPLLKGLKVLLKQEKNPTMQDALTTMGDGIEGGSTFSDALTQHPKIFDNLYVNMVRAGEAGGVLDVVLSRLAEFMEKAEKIKNKVKGAMIYPVVVLVIAVLILTFLMVVIIPKFQEVFMDLSDGKGSLPGLTMFVIGISQFFVKRWYIMIGIIAILVFGVKFLSKTKKGSYLLDKFKLNMPIFGSLVRRTSIARFSRTLGTLLSSGVPILQALNIVKETSGNAVVSEAIEKVHDSVKEGDTMTVPLEASGVFPSMAVGMIDVGEETGALPEMLMKVADTYENEVDTAVEGLTSIIEPLLIIMLAVIVGTIVIAMFLPLLKIMESIAS